MSFCVEKPLTPAARMFGNKAGKPKQSGSMDSALAIPKSGGNIRCRKGPAG
jgi:hypothetical protein